MSASGFSAADLGLTPSQPAASPAPAPSTPGVFSMAELTAPAPESTASLAPLSTSEMISSASGGPVQAGIVKGLGETAHTLGAAAGYLMPKGLRDRLALPTSFTEPGYLKSENGAEMAGKVGESIAEFALGDEALKGLQMSEKLGIAQKLASMAKGSPYIARMLELGMNALRGGVTTVPQQMLHGATPTDALKTGAVATAVGAGTGAAVEAATPLVKAALRGGQPEIQNAIRNAGETATEQAEARSAAVKAAEPVRVHPPDVDPAVRDHARLNPFPGEDIKIKTTPGEAATATEPATKPIARITGPNGSSIDLELDGKTARVKGIINSGKPGDGQRLYDNAIEWAKDSGYDSFEGDKVQTQEGKTAWQRISERHNARMADTFPHTPSIDLTGSRPAPEAPVLSRLGQVKPAPTSPDMEWVEGNEGSWQNVLKEPSVAPKTPSAGIRTTIEDASNAVKAKATGIYKQLDEASGGRWQRYDDALKNIQDKMDEVNGVDDDAYDRLETKRNDIETSQAQMVEDLKGKGIDPKAADAAVAHYKQAMALRDLDKAVKSATTGDIASGATKSESVNPKAFTTRVQKLYDSGRLAQAVGDSGAKALLQEAYSAKSAQAVQQIVKRVAMYTGIGAAMGAGAHATHIFNHVTGNIEPIQ
jgi:hypothetical protein